MVWWAFNLLGLLKFDEMLSQSQLSVLQDSFSTWPVLQIHVELNFRPFLNSHSTSSDSFETFMSASVDVKKISWSSKVKQYLANRQVYWQFIVERAP